MVKNNLVSIGVDEAGRGPLAGPVTVCACAVLNPEVLSLFPKNCDSKKFSHSQRVTIREKIEKAKTSGDIQYCVLSASAKEIDTKGIEYCIRTLIDKCLTNLHFEPHKVYIHLDGRLKAPPRFANQKTIIRGDSKKTEIGLASIIAKTTRDDYMIRVSKKYPLYDFGVHKGYGTKKHRDKIVSEGVTVLHRKTFLRRIIKTYD